MTTKEKLKELLIDFIIYDRYITAKLAKESDLTSEMIESISIVPKLQLYNIFLPTSLEAIHSEYKEDYLKNQGSAILRLKSLDTTIKFELEDKEYNLLVKRVFNNITRYIFLELALYDDSKELERLNLDIISNISQSHEKSYLWLLPLMKLIVPYEIILGLTQLPAP